MITTKKPIWEQCSKEEFDSAMADFPYLPTPYRAVPIYKRGGGVMDQLEGREPDGYRYEKVVGWKNVILLSEAEANDKEIIKMIDQWNRERH